MITIFYLDDWIAVYRNGLLFVEGHSLSFEEGLDMGQANPDSQIEYYYFNDDEYDEDEVATFPNQLEDVDFSKFFKS